MHARGCKFALQGSSEHAQCGVDVGLVGLWPEDPPVRENLRHDVGPLIWWGQIPGVSLSGQRRTTTGWARSLKPRSGQSPWKIVRVMGRNKNVRHSPELETAKASQWFFPHLRRCGISTANSKDAHEQKQPSVTAADPLGASHGCEQEIRPAARWRRVGDCNDGTFSRGARFRDYDMSPGSERGQAFSAPRRALLHVHRECALPWSRCSVD